MSRIMRVLAPDEVTVRLDLMDPTGFSLGRGFSLGTADLVRHSLEAPGVDGSTDASTSRPDVEMPVPLVLMPQANFAAVEAKMAALATELDRATFVIEFRPEGAAASYLIDCKRSPIPSLFRGQDVPLVETLLRDPYEIPVVIRRHPTLRGAGSFI